MANLMRSMLASARGRVSRLVVPLSQQARQKFPEEPYDYTHGGYHPVSLGDTFHSKRYTIVGLCLASGQSRFTDDPDAMPENELTVFVDFVKEGMLQLDPLKRKSAAELLQHEWLS
ncbi:hypothetical protein E4U19_007459 [Claviceps sp. Clav32 group G5]|nr:hypothetical protein E4U19_007459 [Claviceps sp. Clav32 group G5]